MLYNIRYAIFGVRFREFGAEFMLSLLNEVIHVYQLHVGSDLGNSMPDVV
jgi:hypothetical protein